MLLSYSRNKQLAVRDVPSGVVVRTTVNDTFFEGMVELEVKVPELEITGARGEIKRCFNDECQEVVPLLEKAVGLRVGAGITRVINDLLGGSQGCDRLADLVFECFDAVILRFTVEEMRHRKKPESPEEELQQQIESLKRNPRTVTCASP